jgi:hypothetical protein
VRKTLFVSRPSYWGFDGGSCSRSQPESENRQILNDISKVTHLHIAREFTKNAEGPVIIVRDAAREPHVFAARPMEN